MDIYREIITKSAESTRAFGQKIGASYLDKNNDAPRVVCCWGELGSGKTTFVQGLAHGLGVTGRLLSPTFIIVRRYSFPSNTALLYHFDLYRLENEEQIETLGFADIIAEPNSIKVIEWPERLGNLLPKNRVDVKFSVLASGDHKITYT